MKNLIASVLAFASTNIDDIFILTFFYGSRRYSNWQVVAGQFAGIATLVIVSAIISVIGSFFDTRWVGLLGLFPIYMGLKQVLTKDPDEENINIETNSHLPVFAIAGVTVANGGDNIGVYVPFFSTLSITEMAILAIIFTIMVFLWCAIAKYLASHPLAAEALGRYSHIIMPVVLIVLGVFIIAESSAYELVFTK